MKLINRPDIKQRILWFSDIHFLEDPVERYLQFFSNAFIEISKEINDEKVINYVIISGDLTNRGTENEFKKFSSYILKPLFAIQKDSKLLVISGNHDLTIGNIFKYEKFKIINYVENKEHREPFFLNDNNYKSFFKNYTKFCKYNKKYFPKNLTEPYSNDFLYGNYKDEENKLMFILLNSSWLSLGVKLLEHVLEEEYIQPVQVEYESIYEQFKLIKNNFYLNKDVQEGQQEENIKKLKHNISRLESLIINAREKLTKMLMTFLTEQLNMGHKNYS